MHLMINILVSTETRVKDQFLSHIVVELGFVKSNELWQEQVIVDYYHDDALYSVKLRKDAF